MAVAKASSCSSDETSSLGTSICCGCGPKKKKRCARKSEKKKKKKPERNEAYMEMSFVFIFLVEVTRICLYDGGKYSIEINY